MKVEFLVANPSQDWQAVARMLERRHDLRQDVTLVVTQDQLRFVDGDRRPLHVIPQGQWVGGTISNIDTMLDFLEWLEAEYVIPVAHGRFGCPVRGSRQGALRVG